MRQSIASLVLEKLSELGAIPLDAFFPRKYSYARLWRELFGLDKKHFKYHRASPRSFATILGRLKRQGFIAVENPDSQPMLVLTPAGKKYFLLKQVIKEKVPKPDGRGRIVVFDIPEREKAKRDWLRQELVRVGFKKLQKSVWYGENPLPESFFRDLDTFGLRFYVHIFEVRKSGTLHR